MEACEQRLHELRRRDRTRRVFGAEKNQYRSTPVSPADVVRFEAELGVPLPPDYSTFLLRVGFGAGPYFGIWSPQESLTEFRGLKQEYEHETGNTVHPALPFPFRAAILRGIDAQAAAGIRPAVAEQDWPCSGCVPICHHGCTFWSVLVLNGEFVGRVWDVACFVGYSGEWLPAKRPAGTLYDRVALNPLPRPPTFTEWFGGWLDQCEADLTTPPESKPRP